MKTTRTMLAAGLLPAGTAQAGESLSCQVQKDLDAGAEKAPKVSELVWSEAHGDAGGVGQVATSLGAIAPGEDLKTITLDGHPVQLPEQVAGLLRFGKAYDYGDRVVLAYLVEREWDSSATPSEVVYALDKQGTVAEVDVLPGDAAEAGGHCVLIQ